MRILLVCLCLLPLAVSARETNVVAQVVAKVAQIREIPAEATGGEGVVVRLLRDDNEGSRHQRFIVRKPDGSTLLMVHNIDLAPRVPVQLGDTIHFCGEYVWNKKGGLIHWTHRDPQNRHFHGWIFYRGNYYE